MYLQLKDIEPYDMTGRDPSNGEKFFRRLSGRESFHWEGSIKPKSMMLDCIIYKERNGLNTATGHLMSIDIDKILSLLDIGLSFQGILEEYKVGLIQIHYKTEENPPSIDIRAHKTSM